MSHFCHGLSGGHLSRGTAAFGIFPKQGPRRCGEYPGQDFDVPSSGVVDLTTAEWTSTARQTWDVPGRALEHRFASGFTVQGTPPRSSAPATNSICSGPIRRRRPSEHCDTMNRGRGSTDGKDILGHPYEQLTNRRLRSTANCPPGQTTFGRGFRSGAATTVPVPACVAGRIVESRELSDRFLWDYRRDDERPVHGILRPLAGSGASSPSGSEFGKRLWHLPRSRPSMGSRRSPLRTSRRVNSGLPRPSCRVLSILRFRSARPLPPRTSTASARSRPKHSAPG